MNPNERRKTTGVEFWRDEAKLALLSPFGRTRFYMKIPTLLSVGGAIICIVKVHKLMQDDYLLLAGITATLVYPISLCVELFFKGGEAGARLKNEANDLSFRLDDKLGNRNIAKVLATLKHDLEKRSKEWIAEKPSVGVGDDLARREREFDAAARAEALAFVQAANQQIEAIDPTRVLPIDRIAKAADLRDLQAQVIHLNAVIDASGQN